MRTGISNRRYRPAHAARGSQDTAPGAIRAVRRDARDTGPPCAPASAVVIAVFGPTGIGKTAVAIALADRLRERGEDPVAVSADAMQVYAGLPILTGAADAGGAGARSSTA